MSLAKAYAAVCAEAAKLRARVERAKERRQNETPDDSTVEIIYRPRHRDARDLGYTFDEAYPQIAARLDRAEYGDV